MNRKVQIPRVMMRFGVAGTCKHCGALCTLSRSELMISHLNPPCAEYTRNADRATSITEAAELNWSPAPPTDGVNAPGGVA